MSWTFDPVTRKVTITSFSDDVNCSAFGLASIKREGGRLWPSDCLTMNGRLPKRSEYSKEELIEIAKAGFGGDEWYEEDKE